MGKKEHTILILFWESGFLALQEKNRKEKHNNKRRFSFFDFKMCLNRIQISIKKTEKLKLTGCKTKSEPELKLEFSVTIKN